MKWNIFLPSILARVVLSGAQTVYLAGDSTTAIGGGGSGTQGWGKYLGQYLSIPVVNQAVAGESARSYTEQGLFQNLIAMVQHGDYVIVEFGHNDGFAGAVDNGKQAGRGHEYSATETVKDSEGNHIVIHTFPYYIENAVKSLKAKGAIPIVASQTPNNGWSGESMSGQNPSRFVGYAQIAAQHTEVTFLNHFEYVVQAYNKIGKKVVNTYYPNDHVHTSPAGAKVVAEAFVRGLLCGSNSLTNKVNRAGKALADGCL